LVWGFAPHATWGPGVFGKVLGWGLGFCLFRRARTMSTRALVFSRGGPTRTFMVSSGFRASRLRCWLSNVYFKSCGVTLPFSLAKPCAGGSKPESTRSTSENVFLSWGKRGPGSSPHPLVRTRKPLDLCSGFSSRGGGRGSTEGSRKAKLEVPEQLSCMGSAGVSVKPCWGRQRR